MDHDLSDPQTPAVTLHVCVTCRREGDEPDQPRAGRRLADALASVTVPYRLAGVECLGNCARGCTLAMSRPGGWAYVFGGLTPDSGPDIEAAAALYANSGDGLMPWRGRPESFKRGLIARIPPMQLLKDAAE